MTVRRTLVIFVKAPRLGAVKRRLAAGIGAFDAWLFYRRTTGRLIRRVARDPRWWTVLAVTPDRFAAAARFWPAGLARVGQGQGDLGARMARALARPVGRPVGGGPVVLVGSDIPDLGAWQVWQAFRALGDHDLVFGPAHDGGFWLVGTRKAPPRALFRQVRWSSPHALADTRANLGARRRVALLAPLSDVDDAESYRRHLAVNGPIGPSGARSGGA